MQKEEPDEQKINRILALLTDNDRKIYNIVKDHPSSKKDLTNRTKFPSNLIDKITNQLATYNLIKKIKKPESKNLNIWVIYNYQEQEEQTVSQSDKDDLIDLVRKKQGSINTSDLQK